jgi:hypothetical protein
MLSTAIAPRLSPTSRRSSTAVVARGRERPGVGVMVTISTRVRRHAQVLANRRTLSRM